MSNDKSTDKKSYKKEKEIYFEFETQIRDVKTQLLEQIRCIEQRMETQLALLAELQDFFRRRAEIEAEYGRNLDKLAKSLMARHKAEKQRREQWSQFSLLNTWQCLVDNTRQQGQSHIVLSDACVAHVVPKITDIGDDVQRVFKKSRDVLMRSHQELEKTLNELHMSLRAYHEYAEQSRLAEGKLCDAEGSRAKLERQSKGTGSKKYQTLEKQVSKRQHRFTEAKLKTLRARNEYLLALETSNAALQKHCAEDVPDLIDCMSFGYHNSVGRALKAFLCGERCVSQSRQQTSTQIDQSLGDLDSRSDRQRFIESHGVFRPPSRIPFQPHRGDEIRQLSAQKTVQDELLQRQIQLQTRLTELRTRHEEIYKTLEATESSLLTTIDVPDNEISYLFNGDPVPEHFLPKERDRRMRTRIDIEDFYYTKFLDYLTTGNLTARLQAKHDLIGRALGDGSVPNRRPPSLPPKPRKRIGKSPLVGQPRLFGGRLDEFMEATNQEIPMVVTSCIRVLNRFGLQHQGIFRVSGSQVDINHFKEAFEKGEDPLVNVVDSRDINSIAGLLKLYFRELKEPLFPRDMFDRFMQCRGDDADVLCPLVQQLPSSVFIVMRYLFAFLNHLVRFNDENMMDSHNVAICWAPNLIPIPDERDQVLFQGKTIELVETFIREQERIFPRDKGPLYEQYGSDDSDGDAFEQGAGEVWEGDGDSSIDDDGTFLMEAEAMYDFQGRSMQELTFRRNDILLLYGRVSDQWWEGCFRGREGLIPDSFIKVRESSSRRSSATDESSPVVPVAPCSAFPVLSEETNGRANSELNELDSALAQVYSGIQSLEESEDRLRSSENSPSPPTNGTDTVVLRTNGNHHRPSTFADTPDLVLDLPAESVAERFAQSHQGTLRKGAAATPRNHILNEVVQKLSATVSAGGSGSETIGVRSANSMVMTQSTPTLSFDEQRKPPPVLKKPAVPEDLARKLSREATLGTRATHL